MADPRQKLDGFEPLLMRRLDLLHRLVELADDDGHRCSHPLILRVDVAASYDLHRIFFREEASFVNLHSRPHRSRMVLKARRSSAMGSPAIVSCRQQTC